jgi:hypothetical protein
VPADIRVASLQMASVGPRCPLYDPHAFVTTRQESDQDFVNIRAMVAGDIDPHYDDVRYEGHKRMSRTHVLVARNWDEILVALKVADEIILGGRNDFREEVIKKVEVTGFPHRPGDTNHTVTVERQWRVEPATFYPVAIQKIRPRRVT